MSDMVGLPFPDHSLAAEGVGDHIRNAMMLLGGLRRAMQISGLRSDDADMLVDAISVRLDKALQQVEDRHEFGCTAYVGRPCICATLRKERALHVGSRPAATTETHIERTT